MNAQVETIDFGLFIYAQRRDQSHQLDQNHSHDNGINPDDDKAASLRNKAASPENRRTKNSAGSTIQPGQRRNTF